MAAQDELDDSLSAMMRDLQKPLSSTCTSAIQQMLDQNTQELEKSIHIIQENINEASDKLGSLEDVRDIQTYHNKLQEIMKAKEKDVELQTENLRLVSEVKAEKAKLKSDLNNLELQTDTKVKPQHKQLEKEKATFSAYVKLCGHVRLDSQHTGPDVRGTVSLEPSADVTFSLDPATLSAVQLTNRLWQIAAEHVAPAKQCASQPDLANQGAEPLEATNHNVERAKTPEATNQSTERAKTPEATKQDGERPIALEAGKQSITQPSKISEESRLAAKRTAALDADSEMADLEDDDSAKENIPANCVEG